MVGASSMNVKQLALDAAEKREAGDVTAAFDLFLQAATLGDAGAAFSVGYMYDVGLGVAKDLNQALFWYRRAWRGKQHCAGNNIALLYVELGQRRQALLWWRKAIAQGDRDAAVTLAKFLLQTAGGRNVHKQVVDLLKVAASKQEWTEITPAGKEEAEALLLALTRSR